MMTRLLVFSLAALILSACGRDDGPDTPLYSIDQTRPAAPADPALHGCWSSVLRTPVEPRPLILAVEAETAAYRVSLISPGQGGAVVVFDQVRLDGPTLAAATPLGAFRFEGVLDGPDRLSGEVVQGGLTDTLVFDRAEGEPPGC